MNWTASTSPPGRVEFLNPEGLNRAAVVKGLANPDFLAEMDAIAVVPA